jgi:HD-GYP domain-containing protein (c-di-GMP phosphodiesterase class II)
LTKDEYEIIKTHPEKGYHILKPIEKLSEVCDVVYAHHEWYNGNGYPRHLKKDEIPYAASIISVADAYDSITSDRVYRRRRSHKEAVEILRDCSGTQFHPDIVDVFLSMDKEI